MKGIIKQNKKINIAIMLPIFLLGLNFVLYRTNNEIIDKNIFRIVTFIAIIFLLFFYRITKSYGTKKIFLYLILVLTVQVLFNSVAANFLMIILLSLAFKNILTEEYNRLFFIVNIMLFAVWILLAIFGKLDFAFTNYSGRLRFNLGFVNVNSAALFFLSIIFSFSFIKSKNRLKTMIILSIAIVLLYIITDTRSVLVCWIVYCILSYFYESEKLIRFTKRVNPIKITYGIYVVLIFLSFCSVFLLNLFPQLDVLSSFRLTVFSDYITANTILNLFFGGTNIAEIDNFYLVATYSCGAIVMIPVYYIIWISIKHMLVSRKYYQTAFVMANLILGILESSLLRPEILLVVYFWYLIITNYCDSVQSKNYYEKLNMYWERQSRQKQRLY